METREQRIARRIRHLRNQRRPKLTQAKLAEKLGVETNTVWLWENARATPEGSNLAKLATFFDVDEPYFTSKTELGTSPTNPQENEKITISAAKELVRQMVAEMAPKTVEAAVAEFDRTLRDLDFPDGRRALALYLLSGNRHYLLEYKDWKDRHISPDESSRLAQLLQAIQKFA